MIWNGDFWQFFNSNYYEEYLKKDFCELPIGMQNAIMIDFINDQETKQQNEQDIIIAIREHDAQKTKVK